jgi:hypothetical protein
MHNLSGQGEFSGNDCTLIPAGLVRTSQLFSIPSHTLLTIVRDLILRFLVIDPDACLAFDKAMTHPWFAYLGLSRRPSISSMSSEAEVERMLLCDADIEVDVP